MSGEESENDGADPRDRTPSAEWPVELTGVTETVTATLGPNGRWNVAALGVRGPADDAGLATARTWGRTRTRGNFERRGEGYVQFVDDPLLFVEAALGIEERDEPVLDEAAAWTRAEARRREHGVDGDVEWVDWTLRPVETVVRRRAVPTMNRGFGAVVEATVWASRLDVEGYDEPTLRERLGFLEDVVRTAGGRRERAAFDRLWALVEE